MNLTVENHFVQVDNRPLGVIVEETQRVVQNQAFNCRRKVWFVVRFEV